MYSYRRVIRGGSRSQPCETEALEHLDHRRARKPENARDLPAKGASLAAQLLDLALRRSCNSSWEARRNRTAILQAVAVIETAQPLVDGRSTYPKAPSNVGHWRSSLNEIDDSCRLRGVVRAKGCIIMELTSEKWASNTNSFEVNPC